MMLLGEGLAGDAGAEEAAGFAGVPFLPDFPATSIRRCGVREGCTTHGNESREIDAKNRMLDLICEPGVATATTSEAAADF